MDADLTKTIFVEFIIIFIGNLLFLQIYLLYIIKTQIQKLFINTPKIIEIITEI